MKFSYQVGMCDADHYLPLARAAEAAGYRDICARQYLLPPGGELQLSYNKDGSREFLECSFESLIAVTAMAAVTQTIEFATIVYVNWRCARPCCWSAKQVQWGIQVLSAIALCSVGISPWEEDFAVCGVPWDKRGQHLTSRSRSSGAWKQAIFGYEGQLHHARQQDVPGAPGRPHTDWRSLEPALSARPGWGRVDVCRGQTWRN